MPVFNNRTPQYAEQVEGGIGRMQRDRLLEGDQLGGICSYVAQISLEPGCSIGIHQHVGDSEMYFITAALPRTLKTTLNTASKKAMCSTAPTEAFTAS